MVRILHMFVIGALVLAAATVYKIKYDSTLKAAVVAKLRNEVRKERDAIAILRAEWARLDNPMRIQTLTRRHLKLEPLKSAQFDSLDQLPDRPPSLVPPGTPDPIGALVEHFADPDILTASLPDRKPAKTPAKKPAAKTQTAKTQPKTQPAKPAAKMQPLNIMPAAPAPTR